MSINILTTTANALGMIGSAVDLRAHPSAGVASKDVPLLGFKLHYLEAGRGTPVVLLHGLGGDGSRWQPNIEPLAKGFPRLRARPIGFGRWDKPLANYHTGVLADFLLGFMKADRLARTISGSTTILIDNCGHMPQLEQPGEFNRLVREFLTTGRAASTQQ
jgi:pimeloyl-ACP methyl ester carboxylesterase